MIMIEQVNLIYDVKMSKHNQDHQSACSKLIIAAAGSFFAIGSQTTKIQPQKMSLQNQSLMYCKLINFNQTQQQLQELCHKLNNSFKNSAIIFSFNVNLSIKLSNKFHTIYIYQNEYDHEIVNLIYNVKMSKFNQDH